MAYTFKSRAAADIIMLAATGKHIVQILGKTPGEPGIVTVAQIPGAIATLEAAVREDDARRKALQEQMASGNAEHGAEQAAIANELGAVTLRQRTTPLLAMLRDSMAEHKDVIWEVRA